MGDRLSISFSPNKSFYMREGKLAYLDCDETFIGSVRLQWIISSFKYLGISIDFVSGKKLAI